MLPGVFSPPSPPPPTPWRNNLSYAVSLAILFPRAGYDVLQSWLIYYASSSSSSFSSSSFSTASHRRHVLLAPSDAFRFSRSWIIASFALQRRAQARCRAEERAKTRIECAARAAKDAWKIFSINPRVFLSVGDANANRSVFFFFRFFCFFNKNPPFLYIVT